MKIKDGQILSDYEIRKLHPLTSFAESTYGELGWTEYTPPAPEPVVYVPQVVSRFQGEAVLLADGLLDTVESLVAQADPLTQLAWKRAAEFRRASPMIATVAAALGWTDEYIDSLFIRGIVIEA